MLKQIIKKNGFLTIISIILSIISCGAMVYAGYSLTYLFNAYSEASNSIDTFVYLTLKVVLIWVGALILLYLYSTTLSYTLSKMRNTLRATISDKIVSQSLRIMLAKIQEIKCHG